MSFNPEIFKAYDIRGIYGKDFDEEFAYRLGRVLVKNVEGRDYLVAHDTRLISPGLAEDVIRGIISLGGRAHYLGMSTTPLYNFVLNDLKFSGGIMVTASHNP